MPGEDGTGPGRNCLPSHMTAVGMFWGGITFWGPWAQAQRGLLFQPGPCPTAHGRAAGPGRSLHGCPAARGCGLEGCFSY